MTTTGPDGIFLTAIPARDLFRDARGVLELRAHFQAQDLTQAHAKSRPVMVPVATPPGIPVRWYVAALLWVLVGLAVAHIIRHRLWERVLRLFNGLRPSAKQNAALADLVVEEPEFIRAAASASRNPRLNVLSGRVIDAHSSDVVAGAIVAAAPEHGGATVQVATGGRGGFELPPLAPGRYTLSVSSEEYITRSVAIGIPHQGRLDGATLTLVAVRRRLRDLYQKALAKVRADWTWGKRTPTEVLDAAKQTAEVAADPRAEPALERLKELTERAWYTEAGARHPDAVEGAELLNAIADKRQARQKAGTRS